MLASQQSNKYTVIDSQLGIVAHRVSRQDAIDAIYAAVDDNPPMAQVLTLLSTIPDPAAWRSEFAAATARELGEIDERLDNTPTTKDVDELNQQLSENQTEIAELRAAARKVAIADLENQIRVECSRLLNILATEMQIDINSATEIYSGIVLKQVMSGPIGRMLHEIQ